MLLLSHEIFAAMQANSEGLSMSLRPLSSSNHIPSSYKLLSLDPRLSPATFLLNLCSAALSRRHTSVMDEKRGVGQLGVSLASPLDCGVVPS